MRMRAVAMTRWWMRRRISYTRALRVRRDGKCTHTQGERAGACWWKREEGREYARESRRGRASEYNKDIELSCLVDLRYYFALLYSRTHTERTLWQRAQSFDAMTGKNAPPTLIRKGWGAGNVTRSHGRDSKNVISSPLFITGFASGRYRFETSSEGEEGGGDIFFRGLKKA